MELVGNSMEKAPLDSDFVHMRSLDEIIEEGLKQESVRQFKIKIEAEQKELNRKQVIMSKKTDAKTLHDYMITKETYRKNLAVDPILVSISSSRNKTTRGSTTSSSRRVRKRSKPVVHIPAVDSLYSTTADGSDTDKLYKTVTVSQLS